VRGCLSLVSVVCRQVYVSATCQSLVQRSHAECGVSEAGITQGYFAHYSPASGQDGSKLALPITCRNKTAGQSARRALVHHLTSQRLAAEF
jgi:hypothetical protein